MLVPETRKKRCFLLQIFIYLIITDILYIIGKESFGENILLAN